MHWEERNLAIVSDRKGVPLLVKSHLNGPYCEIRCCKHCMKLSEVLEWVLCLKEFTKGVCY